MRLRFSLDPLGAGLEDAVIIYQDLRDTPAWERFVNTLGQAEPVAAPRQISAAQATANTL